MLKANITSETSNRNLEASSTGYKYINNRRMSGYEPEAALGELIDNPQDPIANAYNIQLHFALKKRDRGQMEVESICIIDDGNGMSESDLENCHKLGSSRYYQKTDLGRFGEGGIMGSLSLSAFRQTFSRDKSGVLRMRIYDMELVKEEDTWGTYTREPTEIEEEWFNNLVGENKSGTIIRLKNLDLIRPKTWEFLKKRLENYLPKTYDHWLSSNSDRRIRLKAFHQDEEVYNWKVPTYDPLHWGQKYTINAGLQEEIIHIEDGKIKVRTVLLGDGFSKESRSSMLSNQGGYLYRNGRLIACGEKLQSMLRGSYNFHNDYRRMRYSIHYESDLDAAMGTRPSKDGISPVQSINDKILSHVHRCKTTVSKLVRAKKSKDNHQSTEDMLPYLAEILSAAHIPPSDDRNKNKPAFNRKPTNPSGNVVNIIQKTPKPVALKHKQYEIALVENGRMGIFGDCVLSSNPDYRYHCDFNTDHPMISHVSAKDQDTKTLVFSILGAHMTSMNCFDGIPDLSDGLKNIMKDKFQRSFDDSLRNLISIMT